MEKRLKNYLKQMSELNIEGMSEEQKVEQAARLLLQIGFFQHERLIHLIVTVTFAILTLMSIILGVLMESAPGFLLTITFLILLVPYIRHYYILENGVQKLYTYHDALTGEKIP